MRLAPALLCLWLLWLGQYAPDTETGVNPSEKEPSSISPMSTTHSDSSAESDESGRIDHIMIRVIEGRDLPGVNLRVKGIVDGRSESTRVSSEKGPRWRQNLSFTLNRSMEKVSDTVIELKLYSENRSARDKLHGFLGSILHQPDGAIISKWVALWRPLRDDIFSESENIDFVRISLAIYGNNEAPPPMADDDGDELFSGAQLQQFTLRMMVGDTSCELDAEMIEVVERLSFVALNKEIMWPTVINTIHFALILSKGKKARHGIAARFSVPISPIYVSVEDEFLPTFGPSFVNFYGPQTIPRLERRKHEHPEKDFDEHMFYCRLLVSVDCFDTPSEPTTMSDISHHAHNYATKFEKYFKYSLCCSLFNCSNIDPQFASSKIMFIVSIGNYGGAEPKEIAERCSTLLTTPYPDGTKCFTIPWGNYKPLVFVDCVFDYSAFRTERVNAILKVVALLDDVIDDPRVDRTGELTRELVELKFNALTLADTVVDSMRLLCRIREWVRRMAVDDSASLPDVFVKMFADGKMIGIARIPAVKVSAVLHARFWVGDTNKVKYWLRHIQPADQKSYLEIYQYQKKSMTGVGLFKDDGLRSLTSGNDMEKYTSEEWKSMAGVGVFKDDGLRSLTSKDSMEKYTREAPMGWAYKGRWFVMNSHKIWITEEPGKKHVADKLFELQWKSGGDPSTGWEFKSYMDYYCKVLPKGIADEDPPEGEEAVVDGEWTVDLHTCGDGEGFCYTDCFWSDAAMRDDRQGPMHLYRRRCLQRRKEYNGKEEGLEEFLKGLRPEQDWEYARSEDAPFHDDPDKGDGIRRRRCLVEITKTHEEEDTMNPRLYEVHSTISKWQMRAYILWGKVLLGSPHARVFVRVTLMQHIQETSIVEKSRHPIWNETIIFDDLKIPGAHNGLKEYPPAVLVEIKGEQLADRENPIFDEPFITFESVRLPSLLHLAFSLYFISCVRLRLGTVLGLLLLSSALGPAAAMDSTPDRAQAPPRRVLFQSLTDARNRLRAVLPPAPHRPAASAPNEGRIPINLRPIPGAPEVSAADRRMEENLEFFEEIEPLAARHALHHHRRWMQTQQPTEDELDSMSDGAYWQSYIQLQQYTLALESLNDILEERRDAGTLPIFRRSRPAPPPAPSSSSIYSSSSSESCDSDASGTSWWSNSTMSVIDQVEHPRREESASSEVIVVSPHPARVQEPQRSPVEAAQSALSTRTARAMSVQDSESSLVGSSRGSGTSVETDAGNRTMEELATSERLDVSTHPERGDDMDSSTGELLLERGSGSGESRSAASESEESSSNSTLEMRSSRTRTDSETDLDDGVMLRADYRTFGFGEPVVVARALPLHRAERDYFEYFASSRVLFGTAHLPLRAEIRIMDDSSPLLSVHREDRLQARTVLIAVRSTHEVIRQRPSIERQLELLVGGLQHHNVRQERPRFRFLVRTLYAQRYPMYDQIAVSGARLVGLFVLASNAHPEEAQAVRGRLHTDLFPQVYVSTGNDNRPTLAVRAASLPAANRLVARGLRMTATRRVRFEYPEAAVQHDVLPPAPGQLQLLLRSPNHDSLHFLTSVIRLLGAEDAQLDYAGTLTAAFNDPDLMLYVLFLLHGIFMGGAQVRAACQT